MLSIDLAAHAVISFDETDVNASVAAVAVPAERRRIENGRQKIFRAGSGRSRRGGNVAGRR